MDVAGLKRPVPCREGASGAARQRCQCLSVASLETRTARMAGVVLTLVGCDGRATEKTHLGGMRVEKCIETIVSCVTKRMVAWSTVKSIGIGWERNRGRASHDGCGFKKPRGGVRRVASRPESDVRVRVSRARAATPSPYYNCTPSTDGVCAVRHDVICW